MARTTYEHLLKLTGDNTGMVRAADGSSNALRRLDESSRKGQKSLDKYNSSLQVSARATTALGRAFGGITIGLVAREFIQAADSMTLLEGRLRLVTSGTVELVSTQRELFSVAQDSRASLEATTSFYVRLAQRLGDVSSGSLALSEITELVSKSLKIGGATAKETSSSLLQLSQALSSGLLRGDEFRSLSENAVGLMQSIADGAGVTQAELRALSISGKLTTELILDALEKSAPKIRDQFNTIPVTFGDAIQRLQNVLVSGVADLNKKFEITDQLVDVIGLAADNVDVLALSLGALTALKIKSVILNQVQAFGDYRAAIKAQTADIKIRNAAELESAVVANASANSERIKASQTLYSANQTRQAVIAEVRLEQVRLKAQISAKGLELSHARLKALRIQEMAATKALRAAQDELTLATTRASAANTALGKNLEQNAKKVGIFGKAIGFLGGPLGIALVAAQMAGMYLLFRDSADAIDLTVASTDQLKANIDSLTDLSFGHLQAKKQELETELDWQQAVNGGTEAGKQAVEVLKQTIQEIDKRSEQTEVGIIIAQQDALAQRDAAAASLELAESLVKQARTRDEIDTAYGNQSIAARILADAEEELIRLNAEKFRQWQNLQKTQIALIAGVGQEEVAITKLKDSIQTQLQERVGLREELARWRKIQKEGIKGYGDEAEGQKLVAAEIKKLEEALNGKLKKQKVVLTSVEELEKKERELVEAIGDMTEAHENSGKEVSQYSVKLDKLKDQYNDHMGIVPDVVAETARLNKEYREGKLDIDKYEKELKDLKLTQEQTQTAMEDSGAVYDQVEEALRELSRSQQDQLDIQRTAATEGETAAEVYKTLVELADKYKISIEKVKEKYPDLIADQARFIDQREGIEEVNTAIEEFSTSIIDAVIEGEDMGEFFKNLWKQMAKDFLASGLTKLLGSLLNGGTLDFTGFTSGTGQGGSTLGSLLGRVINGPSSSNGTTPTPSSKFVEQTSRALGIDSATLQAGLQGVAALGSVYAGVKQGGVGGAITAASGGVSAYNSAQRALGGQQLSGNISGGLGVAGGLFGLYSGIKNDDPLSAGLGAAQAYNGYQTLVAASEVVTAGQQSANLAQVLSNNVSFANSSATALDLAAGGAPTPASSGTGFGEAAGTALGVAMGAYNVYSGIERGNSAGYTQAAGGAVSVASALGMLPALGPYGVALGAVLSLLAAGRGSRPYEQILQEDYLPDLLGVNAGSAIGTGGATGFDGGNTAIFGANFGIQGSGLTAQLLNSGGENGNGGFFTGAQESLDGFEKALRDAGFDELINNVGGVLRVFDKDKTVDDVLEVWQAYRDGLDDAVAYNKVFKTAIDNGLLKPSNLFFEQFAIGFGQSAFSAKESLGIIDKRFDEMTANGIEKSDALFRAISEHYGIAIEDAQFFVERTGISADQWANNFESASGKALDSLLEFNADGVTAFESGLGQIDASAAGAFEGIRGQFAGLSDLIANQSAQTVQNYINDIGKLSGALSGVDLGTPTIGGGNILISGFGGTSLGNFSSALAGSETLNIGGSISGSRGDSLYSIGLNQQEAVTVNKKGMIERIEKKIDNLSGGGVSEVVSEIRNLVSVMSAQQQELEFIRGRIHEVNI